MALEARRRVKVGECVYGFGERLAPEHEAEMRARPAFSLLIEDGDLVEVADEPSATQTITPTEKSDPPAQKDSDERFDCPHCPYTTDKRRNLNAHIQRNHKAKKGKQARKR